MPNTNSDSNRRKLLYIVTWNIGGLDYMVAVLWRLRTQYPNVDITVFFAEPHYDHVLRGGRFFLELFDSLDIEYKDFRDLLHPFTKSLLKLVNPLLALSPADYTTPMWIQRLQYLFNRFILSEQRFSEFLNSYEPDCIIIDDRKYYLRPFCGYKELETYYDAHPTLPIIQIPHAIKSEYYGDLFPNGRLCEIWLPFVAWQDSLDAINNLKNVYQTFVPSLDEGWIKFAKNDLPRKTTDRELLTCVVLLQPFDRLRDKNPSRKQFTYEEMKNYLEVLSAYQFQSTKQICFLIKPHPKQNSKTIKRILNETGISNYILINETSHYLLSSDLCISMITTAVYPFLVARIPTVMILTKIVPTMPHADTIQLKELYTNLTYACSTSDEIANAIDEILTKGHQDIERDYQHIRTYLPDHALDTVMDRLRLHLHLDNQPKEIKGISA